MLPPGARGTVSYVAPAGHYNINEEVIEVDFQGSKKARAPEPRISMGRAEARDLNSGGLLVCLKRGWGMGKMYAQGEGCFLGCVCVCVAAGDGTCVCSVWWLMSTTGFFPPRKTVCTQWCSNHLQLATHACMSSPLRRSTA